MSAHPDVILKMGVKDVLYRTRHLGWGADTHRYDSAAVFGNEFPSRLRESGPRVLKQNRGNGGQGVWKVEALLDAGGLVRVLHAQRGSLPEDMSLQPSWPGANRISAGAAASSTSRFSRVCPTA